MATKMGKSAAMQRAVLELLCSLGSVAVKELCYFTGASTATVNRLEKLGYLTLSEQPVLRCREIKAAMPQIAADFAAIPVDAADALYAIYEGGYLSTLSDGTIAPLGELSRGDAAKFFSKILDGKST